jgi:hypothetical protein
MYGGSLQYRIVSAMTGFEALGISVRRGPLGHVISTLPTLCHQIAPEVALGHRVEFGLGRIVS